MHELVIAVSRQQVSELGLGLGVLGALVVALGAVAVLSGRDDRRRERMATLVGALLIAVAFGVQIGAFHVSTPINPGGTPSPAATSTP
jgi:hypothetical protein